MNPVSINNGSRVDLAFAAGPAGIVVDGDTARLSYVRSKGAQPRVGAPIEIDGESWTVTASAPSDLVRGMVVASLARTPAGD